MSGTADGLVVFGGPADLAVLSARLPALFLADAKSSERFWEFFAANIQNRNTLRAYYKAACSFSDWCKGSGLFDLTRVKPIQVAAYVEELQLRRRAKTAGIQTKIGNHTFRATGITAYLKNGGKLEIAQQIAAHESPRTTGCTIGATMT